MRITRGLCVFLIISSLFSSPWCEVSYCNESSPSEQESLINKYHEIEEELKESLFAIPFHIESSESNNTSYGHLYSIINYPLDTLKSELLVPASWCQIVLLHPDIRACTYQQMHDRWLLHIYNVANFSKPLGDAYHMKFVFPARAAESLYFDVAFTADEGPFHTQAHQFEFEAIPLTMDTTFIHLRYSYRYSSWGHFLMTIFSSGKVGFSVVGMDGDHKPVYIDGPRGSVERNVARFYLAVMAYMDTLNIPVEQRFEKRISLWYDLASPYRKQLLGMKKDEYLTYKRQDQRNQQKLQSDVDNEAGGVE